MASRKQPIDKASNPKDGKEKLSPLSATAAATTATSSTSISTSAPRRTFYTEGPPDATLHYMVPVNDLTMAEMLAFFTSNDRQRGAAVKFCAVYGHRQGGKSTRLAEVKWRLKERNLLVVEIDTRELSDQPQLFYASFAYEIATALRMPDSEAPCPTDRTKFQRLFKGEGFFACIMRKLKKNGLILLFEEMDGLRCKEEFWLAISPLLEKNQKELDEAQKESREPQFPNILRGVIGVGVHRIVRDSNPGSTSSPPNKKRDILVPHFTKEQVATHLWQPAERDYNFKLTDDAKELLFEFIHGHPGLTCRAGTKILALVSKQRNLRTCNSAQPPFSFTRSHAVSILHEIICYSGHETPLNDIVNALDHRFESGELLKEVLHSLLLEGNRPGIHHATKELYFAIDKGLLRFEEENRQELSAAGTTGYLEFECPIILNALLPRIFPEVNDLYRKVDKTKVVNSIKNMPNEFHTLLEEFTRSINISTLQRSSTKTQRRLARQLSCSEKIPVEAAYHFQFYFFLGNALSETGFSVLAELHPWKLNGQEKTRKRIDLYVNGNEFHFGIELAAGIENSKYTTYLKRTEDYRAGFDDNHAFFILFTSIPYDLWSDLWKGVENQAQNEAGTGVFSYIVSHDSQFVKWTIYGYNIPAPIEIQRQSDATEALLAGVKKLCVTQKLVGKDSTGSPVVVKPYKPQDSKQDGALSSVNPTRKLFDDAGTTSAAPPAPFFVYLKIEDSEDYDSIECGGDMSETIEQLVLRINKELGTEGKRLRRIRQNTPKTRLRSTQFVAKALCENDIIEWVE